MNEQPTPNKAAPNRTKPNLPPNWQDKPLLEKANLRAIFGNVADSTLNRWISEGMIPPGIRIGPRRLFWRAEDIVAALKKMNSETKRAA